MKQTNEDNRIIFKPIKVDVLDKTYKLFVANFSSLGCLYDYLTSNPRINTSSFNGLSSEVINPTFYGKSYEEALDDLLKQYYIDESILLEIKDECLLTKMISSSNYVSVKTPNGGSLNIHDYVIGSPLCYECKIKKKQFKFINIYIKFGYTCYTDFNQIRNRALAILIIVKTLENYGYKISLFAFNLVRVGNELIYTTIDLQKNNQKINLSDLYKVFYKRDFLRRIIFRVFETLNVGRYWGNSYGKRVSEEFIRQFLHMKKNDILIDEPIQLGIKGNNFANDLTQMIKVLGLTNLFDMDKVAQIDESVIEENYNFKKL